MALSFGFSKDGSKKSLKSSVLKEDVETVKDETEYVLSLEEKRVHSTKAEKKEEELIIPLINTNNWRLYHPERDGDGEDQGEEDRANKSKERKYKHKELSGNEEDVAAAKELIKESTTHRNEDNEDAPVVPLLVRNKIPDGFETDEKLDVTLRPEDTKEADYDHIPIEKFGKAMLRGMGWKDGQGVGKNNQKNVAKPLHAVARPKTMGLGADRSASSKSNKKVSSGGAADDEELEMKVGAYCKVTGGKQHKDAYAKITSVDEENVRVIIKLALSSDTFSISQYNIQLVNEKEYKRYGKYLNKEKADKHQKQQITLMEEKSRQDVQENGSKRKHESSHHKSERHHENDRHHDESKRHKEDKRSSIQRYNSELEPQTSWLHPYLRVRIVDKKYKKGKYFKEKVLIEDVVSRNTCVCRTEDNRLLEDLQQHMLETVIPKCDPAHVMVVSGKYKNQVGMVLDRNKRECTAMVQFLPDRDVVKTLDYDVICEYVGPVDGDI